MPSASLLLCVDVPPAQESSYNNLHWHGIWDFSGSTGETSRTRFQCSVHIKVLKAQIPRKKGRERKGKGKKKKKRNHSCWITGPHAFTNKASTEFSLDWLASRLCYVLIQDLWNQCVESKQTHRTYSSSSMETLMSLIVNNTRTLWKNTAGAAKLIDDLCFVKVSVFCYILWLREILLGPWRCLERKDERWESLGCIESLLYCQKKKKLSTSYCFFFLGEFFVFFGKSCLLSDDLRV